MRSFLVQINLIEYSKYQVNSKTPNPIVLTAPVPNGDCHGVEEMRAAFVLVVEADGEGESQADEGYVKKWGGISRCGTLLPQTITAL